MAQEINLYDPSLQKARELVTVRSLVLLCGGLLLLLVAVAVFLQWQVSAQTAEQEQNAPRLAALKTEQQALETRLQTIKPDAALEQEVKKAQGMLDARALVLDLMQKGMGSEATDFAAVMRGFARQTPSGIWLTGFRVNVDPNAMEIRGRTQTPSLIPEYIRRLNEEKQFKGQAFSALSLQAVYPQESGATGGAANSVVTPVAAAPALAAAAANTSTPAVSSAPLNAPGIAMDPGNLSAATLAVTSVSASAAPAAAPAASSASHAAKAPAYRAPLYHEFVLTPVAKLPASSTATNTTNAAEKKP